MAGKKRTPKVTTTASFNGEEGADNAPSTPMEQPDAIHADVPPSGALGEETPPTEEQREESGFVKVVALLSFQCYAHGTGMYPLVKGTSTYVHRDHLEGMLRAGVIRELRDGDE